MTLDAQSLNLNARQILLKRLSTAQALAYTGPLGEVVIDTNLKLLRIQDGVTPGGVLMATSANIAHLQSQINSILNNIDPAALDSLSEVVANVNALLANNIESQLVNSGFYANLSNTGNLTIDGSLLPNAHLAQDLGSPTKAWRSLYISNATAYFGNAALTVTNNGLQVFNANNQPLPIIANIKFPDGSIQSTAVDMAVLANIYTLLTPNVSANLNTIHTDVTNAISYFGNLANAAVTTVQANLQSQINYIKTNIDPAALDSLTEIVTSFQGIDANVIANVSTLTTTVANLTANASSQQSNIDLLLSERSKLVSGSAELVLSAGGAQPYVLFPAATNTSQLQISEAELSSLAGNLTLTSAEDAYVITNGSGAAPGGSKNWKFDRGGNLTLPNNAVIKDTDTNSISFGRAAGDSGQGNLTVAIGNQAGEIGQGLQSTAVGSYAGNYNQGIGTVAIGSNAGALNQGLRAVAIGGLAGAQNQGAYAVALGNFAGGTNQPNNSIVINASGTALNGSASGLFIDPIREDTGNIAKVVYYNISTKELTYADLGAAATVDITNTNGLSTTFYPTFVENRTSGQTIRADVDLTYRSDDNLLRSGNIQVGRNIYGSTIGGISDAIQLRPDIDIDKRFLFKVDSISGNYVRSSMEMPVAEVDKAVTLAFTHNNGNSGFIYIQGTDTNATDFNDAFNIMMNSGNVKISALSYAGGNKVWNFDTTGNLTLPQTDMNSSPAPVSLPGITWTDGTFQTGRTIKVPQNRSLRIETNVSPSGAGNIEISHNRLTTSGIGYSLAFGNTNYFAFDASQKRFSFSESNGHLAFGTETRNQTGHFNDIEIKSYGDGINGNVYITAGGSPTNTRWAFQQSGTIRFPDATTQETAYIATSEQKFDIKSTAFTAAPNTRYGVNTTSGAVIATLPASPGLGDAVFFVDAGGAMSSNNLTIARNGNTIMGSAADIVVNTNGDSLGLFWNGTTWRLYE